MRIGVPKEIKANENRVGLVPACVRELTGRGHKVVVETGAGLGAGLTDATSWRSPTKAGAGRSPTRTSRTA